MNDTTMVEMVHVSGEEAQTHELHIEAGETLIKGSALVEKLYVLREGTIMVRPRTGLDCHLAQTEYIGIGTEWSILGAHPFFSMSPSRYVYTALTDCTLYTFDSHMFQTARDGKGLSHEALLAIARGLILNSDISEVFVPKVAKVLGFDISKYPNLQELQAGIELISSKAQASRFQKQAFNCLVALLKKHEEVSKGPPKLVGSQAFACDRRIASTPPPPPGSLPRKMWEAGRAS